MGVTSQLLSTFSRKPIFGYKAMVYAILGIGFLGFFITTVASNGTPAF